MRALVQKVDFAKLETENHEANIGNGYVIFLGIKKTVLMKIIIIF